MQGRVDPVAHHALGPAGLGGMLQGFLDLGHDMVLAGGLREKASADDGEMLKRLKALLDVVLAITQPVEAHNPLHQGDDVRVAADDRVQFDAVAGIEQHELVNAPHLREPPADRLQAPAVRATAGPRTSRRLPTR